MKKKTLNARQLAKRIAGEVPPREDGDCLVRIDRSWNRGAVPGMLPRTMEELVKLHDGLGRAVPNDFDFCLEFSDDGRLFANLEFDDGNAGFWMPFPVPLDRNLFASLRELNWDEIRGSSMQATQFQDDLADDAAAYPSRLEPCEVVQARHRSKLAAFTAEVEATKPPIAVLACDEEFGAEGYENTRPRSVKGLLGELGDLMTCGRVIIAIAENGKLITPAQVDELKQDALRGLGPISRAKAEGRFWDAVEAMGGQLE